MSSVGRATWGMQVQSCFGYSSNWTNYFGYKYWIDYIENKYSIILTINLLQVSSPFLCSIPKKKRWRKFSLLWGLWCLLILLLSMLWSFLPKIIIRFCGCIESQIIRNNLNSIFYLFFFGLWLYHHYLFKCVPRSNFYFLFGDFYRANMFLHGTRGAILSLDSLEVLVCPLFIPLFFFFHHWSVTYIDLVFSANFFVDESWLLW